MNPDKLAQNLDTKSTSAEDFQLPLNEIPNPSLSQTWPKDKFIGSEAYFSRLEPKILKYHCPECQYKTDNASSLKRHGIVHKKKFQCKICSYSVRQKSSFIAHLEKHAKEMISGSAPASNVPKKSPKENGASIKTFEASFMRGPNKSASLPQPLQSVPPSGRTDTDLVSPEESSAVAFAQNCSNTSPPPFLQNIDTPSSSDQSFGSSSPSDSNFCISLSSKQGDDSPPFHTSTKLNGTENPDPFKCSVCSFSTKVKGNLKLHSLKHSKKCFSCAICNFVTSYQSALKNHQEKHLERILKCADCSYATTMKSRLVRHSLMHTQLAPYRCSKCNVLLFKSEDFKSHICHRNLEPLICAPCHFITKDKSEFNAHIKSHSSAQTELQIKSYECRLCSFKTDSLVAFNYHLNETHNMNSEKSESRKVKNNWIEKLSKKLDVKPGTDGTQKRYSWSLNDKLEIYWCHVYAGLSCFEKWGSSERRRKMLLERGRMDSRKIENVSNSRILGIIAHIKAGKTMVTEDDKTRIRREVEEYAKQNFLQ